MNCEISPWSLQILLLVLLWAGAGGEIKYLNLKNESFSLHMV